MLKKVLLNEESVYGSLNGFDTKRFVSRKSKTPYVGLEQKVEKLQEDICD